MSAKGRRKAAPVAVERPPLDPRIADVLAGRARHALIRGDCLDPVTGMASLPDGSVDVTITDPPYDEQTHSRGGTVVRHDGGPDIAKITFAPLTPSLVRDTAEQIARVTRRWSLVFCAVRQIEQWASALESFGVRVPRVIIWVKPDASPQFSGDRPGHGYESIVVAHPVGRTRWNGGGKKGVYEHLRIDRQSGHLHETQKPIDLLLDLVRDFSDEGEIVCDPFTGSGTTATAASRLGRRAIGWERDANYHAIACRRIAGDEAKPRPEQPSLFGAIPGGR